MSDRGVMRATLLRGTAVIYGSDVTAIVYTRVQAQGGERKKPGVSFKLSQWESVMKAGLAQYRVGVFVEARDAQEPYRVGQMLCPVGAPTGG